MSNPSHFRPSCPADPVGREVVLLGLDFGSTTSSAMVASAPVVFNSASGRSEFGLPRMIFKSDPVFTPFDGDAIDLPAIEQHLDIWLNQARILPKDIFSGGAIVTGLAAKRKNARALARLVHDKIGDAVMATADDPCLESWLAFMGNCSALSRKHPDICFINLDIGGGTTNPAWGINDTVFGTGCHYIGARHFRFEPRTYRLTQISEYGEGLLKHLGIPKTAGDLLAPPEKEAVLDAYVAALRAVAAGDVRYFASKGLDWLQQVPFAPDFNGKQVKILFSGGVGELIYRGMKGKNLPSTTFYGDLGVDLAEKILADPVLCPPDPEFIPHHLGRATVYGLTLNSTQISGTTLFISHPDMLPVRDLPIVARLPITAGENEIRAALSLVRKKKEGACIQILAANGTDCAPNHGIVSTGASLDKVRSFGRKVHELVGQLEFAPNQLVALVAPHNYGQALGNYATNWRQSPVNFIVVDEIQNQRAHFVNIGRPLNQMVPVSFYGVH